MARPTIRDVARHAGVGIGTVSRVLNNSPSVREDTKARVLKAIEALGFKPSHVARQLPRKARLHNIGVITQTFFNYHSFVERLRGVQEALAGLDETYEIVLYNVSSPDSYDERLALIAGAGAVEGLLIIDMDLAADHRELLERSGIPYVGLNEFHGRHWVCVGCNNVDGGYMAAEYLIELGHRRIAYVGDEFLDHYGFCTSSERFEGYRRALEAHNITPDDNLVALGEYGYEQARDMTMRLLSSGARFTAIFAMSDLQALGCIEALHQAGLRVPHDVSVIGYDDLEMSYHAGLTTVSQHLQTSGRLATEYLLGHIRGDADPPAPQPPPLEVIPRRTTRHITTE
jgi:DNA-binding LacI/PurR family transcriptional regulator